MSSLLEYVWLIPHAFVCVFGLVLVIVNWSRYPTASLLAFLAILLIGVSLLTSVGVNVYMRTLHEGGRDFAMTANVVRLSSLLRSLLGAASTAMFLFAIYAGRKAAPVAVAWAPPEKPEYR